MFKSFSFLNWICVLLLGVALAITTGCGKDKKAGGTAKSPTTVPYMHPDFRVAIVIRPQQLLKSKLVTSVTSKLPDDPLKEMKTSFQEETGLDLNQIQRVVVLSNAFMPFGGGMEAPKGEALPFGSDEGFAPDAIESTEDPGTDSPRRDNGASLEKTKLAGRTFPVALQQSAGFGPDENIEINEADMFPSVSPFFCIVIDVNEGVDLTAAAEKITSSKTTVKQGDHSYYSNSDGKNQPSACVVTKTTLLLAEEPHMQKILATGNSDSPLSQALKTVESTNDLSLVVLVGNVVKDMGVEDTLNQLGSTPNPFIPPQVSQNAGLVKDIQTVTVAVSLSSDTPLQVSLHTSSGEVAAKLTSSLEELKKMGQEQIAGQDPETNPIAGIMNSAINGLTINANNSHVSVALKLSQEDLQKAADMAVQFMTLFGPFEGGSDSEVEAIEFPQESGSTESDSGSEAPPEEGRKIKEEGSDEAAP